jgi:uncharacterized protein (TIGR02001 family)
MNMNKLSTLCLAASTLLATSSAMAWESADGQHSTSASVAMTSDYVWRGYTQTDNKPAISGSFDYGHASGFYAGTWASNVNYGDDASTEIDIYAGYANEIGDTGIGYDLALLRYIYPGEDYGYNEVIGSVSYGYFTAGFAHTNDSSYHGDSATYYNLGFDYDLPMDVALSAGIGYYDYRDSDIESPTDYRIGLSKEFVGFGWDITYIDSDSDAEETYGRGVASDSRFVFTVSKSL